MKKISLSAMFVLVTLASCQKNFSANLNGGQTTLSNTASSMPGTASGDLVVRMDVTGDQFGNPCTGGTLTVLSGVIQFNIAPDGFSIRSTVIHNVVQDETGTIYHGMFIETFELKSISKNTFMDNFNWVLSPQGGGTTITIHGVVNISIVNGVATAVADHYSVGCH